MPLSQTDLEQLALHSATADNLSVPIFILSFEDGAFTFISINKRHEEVTGMARGDLAGKRPHDILPRRMADTVVRNYQSCIDHGARFAYEELLALPTGEIWWETTLSPIRGEAGIIGVAGVAVDITARKATEIGAAHDYGRLHRLNQDVAAFMSMAAHDLRAPLRQIRVMTEMIEDGFQDLGDNKLELLQTCRSVVDNSLEQLDSVLQYSSELDITPVSLTSVDFGHLCRDVAAVLDPLGKFEIEHTECVIECDAVCLQVVLRNLLDNASKFAHAQIMIDVRQADGKDGMLEFCVADDGPGFKDTDLAFVGHAKDAKNKTGLGLATVSGMVEARGGRLWHDHSGERSGAIIRWTLPGNLHPGE
ncbi:MAG: PAS domain-containing sensor histidine kinase [Rhizobiaceae bacterium]|nr:PAS domain-containing sensor histidine kinase [Rhizobiaceae bacterium]